jgi:aminoglycoside/choline kinase family phosphotransferase
MAYQQLPAYSYEKLMTEMRLLTEWMLPSLEIQPTEQQLETIEQAFDFLSDCSAINQPQVIVHRDYHSRNLMKIENEQVLGVIDFQDAVIGADTYDLISITRDAYVQWNAARVYGWFEVFYNLLPATAKENRSFEAIQA